MPDAGAELTLGHDTKCGDLKGLGDHGSIALDLFVQFWIEKLIKIDKYQFLVNYIYLVTSRTMICFVFSTRNYI